MIYDTECTFGEILDRSQILSERKIYRFQISVTCVKKYVGTSYFELICNVSKSSCEREREKESQYLIVEIVESGNPPDEPARLPFVLVTRVSQRDFEFWRDLVDSRARSIVTILLSRREETRAL